MLRLINTLRFILCFVIALLIGALGAEAQSSRGVSDYDFRADANVRRDTRCLLKIDGDEVHNGFCDVYRQDGGRVTIVDIGERKFKIVRDAFDNSMGTIQSMRGRTIDETVYAQGGCWRGDRVRFCAKL